MYSNGKLVSYKTVIQAVYRDFKFDYILRPLDAIEWIGEAYRMLKVPAFYIEKITDGNKELNHLDYIEIKNGKGELPCDLYSVTQVTAAIDIKDKPSDNASVIIAGLPYYDYETGETCYTGENVGLCKDLLNCCPDNKGNYSCNCNSDPCSCSTEECPRYSLVPMRWKTNTFHTSYHNCNLDFKCNSDLTYTINNNYIFTSFPEGHVCMAYRAVPTDEDGMPMIPDHQALLEFLKYFVAQKIATQLFITDKWTRDKFDLFDSNLQLWFRKAKNEAKMLRNLDEWESFKNERIRMIPKFFDHSTFFSNLQRPQAVWNHPRYSDFLGRY